MREKLQTLGVPFTHRPDMSKNNGSAAPETLPDRATAPPSPEVQAAAVRTAEEVEAEAAQNFARAKQARTQACIDEVQAVLRRHRCGMRIAPQIDIFPVD